MKFLMIFLGGGLGSLTRFLISKSIGQIIPLSFPLGTLSINLTGCFVIGLLSGIFENWIIPENLRLFIFIGFLGGYTTFSSFGLETFKLLQTTEYNLAFLNIILSNLIGIPLVFFGFILSKIIINFFK